MAPIKSNSDFDRERGIRYHRKALARADARGAKYAAAAPIDRLSDTKFKRLALFGTQRPNRPARDSVPAKEPAEIRIPTGA